MLTTADPDAALLAGLRARDERAFAELVERHGPALLRHARTFVHSAASAEDVVQETWLAVVTGVERFEGRALLRTWLYGIVANRARTRAVRERRSVPFSALASAELHEDFHPVDAGRFEQHDRWSGHWTSAPEPWPDEQVESEETLALVAAAIDELPPAQREVVRLRDVEGWEAEEVCAALELSAGNQRVLLHRGRARVRAALEVHLARALV
jgi:RNA polymerase sigma-70 factor (ECF subfamily)